MGEILMADELPPIPEGFSLAEPSALPPVPEGFSMVESPPAKEPMTMGDWLRQKTAAGLIGARETLPFAKDISAATKAYMGVPGVEGPTWDFTEAKKGVERQQEAAAAESPLAYGAGEVGAFFVPAGEVGSLAGAAGKAEQAIAAKAAPYLGKTGAEILGAAGAGAGLGAVQGAGEGTGLGERLESAAETGALGAGLGAAFPVAGKALGLGTTAAEQAASRLGVSMPASVSSPNPFTRAATLSLSNLPYTRGIIEKGTARGISELGEVLEKPVGISRPGLSMEQAGASAGSSLKNWISTDSKPHISKMYTQLESMVDPNIKTPMSETLKAVQAIDAERFAANLGDSGAAKIVLDAATNPNGLTYAGAQRLKREVGEKIKGLFTDTQLSETELKRLYSGLAKDVENAAFNAGGPQARDLFNKATRESEQVIRQRKRLAKIVGAKGEAEDSAIFKKLFDMSQETGRGNSLLLKAARKSMSPQAWEDVTSGVIARMGRDAEGNFSPDRFVTAYSKFSDAGRNAMFGPPGNPLRNSMDDILTVAQRYKDIGKQRNFSNTATTLLGGLGAYEIASEGLEGAQKEAALVSVAAPAAFILSRPRLAAVVANYLKNPNNQALKHARNVIQMEMRDHFGTTPPSVAEDREQRASGGKVGKRDYPAKRLNRMERAALKAHNQIALETESLLKMPDEHIAHALKIAQGD